MTEQEALWAGVRQEIARAQAQYQEEQEDSYLSHVRAAEEQTLQALYERLQAGESGKELLAWLRQELPRLEEWMEQELERPSFDWYDEHYHYKCLEGRRNACQTIEKLLTKPPRLD